VNGWHEVQLVRRALGEIALDHAKYTAHSPSHDTTSAEDFGELLYGRRWKSHLANDLGVHRRTVMCWAQKEWTIPTARGTAVMGLAKKRIGAIRAALKGGGRARVST
jgi:hypothetical protein